MEFPTLNFDHDEDSFVESFGMNQTQYETARYTIVYEITSVIVLENELDIEVNHGSTKSSVLERSLFHFKDDSEMTFMTVLLFDTVYRDIRQQMDFMNKMTDDVKNKRKADDPDSVISVMRVKGNSIEDAMNQIKLVLQAEKMMALLSFLKDSQCDYPKFIDYTVHEKSRSEILGEDDDDEDETPKKRKKRKVDTSDIDDLIRKAFMNKDDDEDDNN